jgi:hypothetical protein
MVFHYLKIIAEPIKPDAMTIVIGEDRLKCDLGAGIGIAG